MTKPSARTIKPYAISWDHFHRDTRLLAKKLQNLNTAFTGVIAVTRGGLVPAAIVARELNIRLIETLCISSYDDQNQGELSILKSVEGDGKNWLVIDDLVDSGRTAEVIRHLLPKAYFVVVYAKPQGKSLVDNFLIEIEQTTWIDFPWDLDPELQFIQPLACQG